MKKMIIMTEPVIVNAKPEELFLQHSQPWQLHCRTLSASQSQFWGQYSFAPTAASTMPAKNRKKDTMVSAKIAELLHQTCVQLFAEKAVKLQDLLKITTGTAVVVAALLDLGSHFRRILKIDKD
jgi:hypothetical protein